MSESPSPSPSSPVEPPAQPRSSYELPTRKNTTLRNMLRALGVTMALVVLVGFGFFGVNSGQSRQPLENSDLDLAESAQRAEEAADFPIAVPAVSQEWTERSARFSDGEPVRWQVQYTSPDGSLVTLTQEREVTAPLLSQMIPGASVEEQVSIDGVACDVLVTSEEDSESRAVSCQSEQWGLLIHGGAGEEELRELAELAVADLTGRDSD